MHIDLHYDQRKHQTFAAYDAFSDWIDQQNQWYGAAQQTQQFQDAIRGRQEATDYLREGRDQDNSYRNAALRQSGANAATSARAGVQSAQIAAKARLKEAKMTIEANYRTFREKLNELEIPTLQLDAWYRSQQVGLAKANLALEARGPRNSFQAASAFRELDPSGVPASLAAIARNQPAYAFEGMSGMPEAMTYDDLAAKYFPGSGVAPGAAAAQGAAPSMGSGTPGQDQQREDAALAAMRMATANGPQGHAPGTLESMTDYEREIFSSGLEKLGYNADDYYQRYTRSLPGQQDVRLA